MTNRKHSTAAAETNLDTFFGLEARDITSENKHLIRLIIYGKLYVYLL